MSFESFVHNAPKVLFWIGSILAVLAFMAALVPAFGARGGGFFFTAIFAGLAASLNMLVIPWAAAAALWRFDKVLEGKQ